MLVNKLVQKSVVNLVVTSVVLSVASGLDSLVLGEPQILGQVKEAFDAANEAGTMGTLLGRCFTQAFATAKRVRNETGIAEGTVSVSSISPRRSPTLPDPFGFVPRGLWRLWMTKRGSSPTIFVMA